MTAATSLDPPAGFRHEGFLYTGDESFLSGTVPFIEQGVSSGESVLVVVNPRKQVVTLYRSLVQITVLGLGASIDAPEIIPGWTFPVEDVFQ